MDSNGKIISMIGKASKLVSAGQNLSLENTNNFLLTVEGNKVNVELTELPIFEADPAISVGIP